HLRRQSAWPPSTNPDGKITAVKIRQIRDILTDAGVFHIASDSRLVLLSKYKLVFYSDQPRYNLRPHRAVLTPSGVNKAETGQPPNNQEVIISASGTVNQIGNAPNSVIPDLPASWPTANWHRPTRYGYQHAIINTRYFFGPFLTSKSQSHATGGHLVISATQETPSQPIPMHLLMSTLNTISQNTVQIGNTSVLTMSALAEGLANLSGATKSLQLHHSQTLLGVLLLNLYLILALSPQQSGDEDVKARSSLLRYTGTLLQYQRTWIQWQRSSDDIVKDDSDSNSVSSQSDNMNLDEADPSFPYPNGPVSNILALFH
ncbi:hypothetical protein VP01_6252g1, partial [Puccinia sorghi]